MSKLVLIHTIGDGCTYSCERVVPIVHPSKEDALLEFQEAAEAAWAAKVGTFSYLNRSFDTSDFFHRVGGKDQYFPPDIWTIDEWFFYTDANGEQG
jgi:hypothetical protein